ncbi:beta-1,6-N-acetylglucosaminyltransferase [Pseudoroseicyclus tamaricis]|uniref:Peptide O-xylosyltransferase n=1 Tax=Pseudoroseicyclus tamaricis TaxID=2705421 RepID=A0A6B2JWG9_9RHOB|nr:beta-1,6-N-acetylglucosaminyltransferase [Pseudoroseicyclus tamaricis]NDV02847.1 beta-1,6-N-acetylglucosaminyltransferase [Pseudoroseicyclus tamaricis]
MRLGVIMLVHTALHRAEAVIRRWTAADCPVVVHVDKATPREEVERFTAALADLGEMVSFARRHRCEWGTWGLVAATQDAAEQMLLKHRDVGHVYLASGSCLPLRPVEELKAYLAARPEADFIESATTADVPWTVGGLSDERFTLRFPFSWKRRRKLFDGYVNFQRRIGFRRRIPAGIVPHMGSQWWCLSRRTLSAILTDPLRLVHDRYFRRVWIPDESYFQTLVRLYSTNVESRSLTLSKFDFQGKPHIFYDDHLELLRRSDCFVARKIWPHADLLYETFLGPLPAKEAEPNPGKIDRVFAKAVERRTRGRPGLYMQSRFPNAGWENGVTSARYCVFEGLDELFEDFAPWLARLSGAKVHGHLFAPEGAEFEGGQAHVAGALSAAPGLRDRNPRMFLTNLIWNARGERQCFSFGPADNQAISWDIAKDPSADISVVSGAWAVSLFRSGAPFEVIRARAARLQKLEADHIAALRSPYAKAAVKVWTMAEFVEAPMEVLQHAAEAAAPQAGTGRLTEVPKMADLAGFGRFLQQLKNEGMHPHLMGDYPVDPAPLGKRRSVRKPYLVR